MAGFLLAWLVYDKYANDLNLNVTTRRYSQVMQSGSTQHVMQALRRFSKIKAVIRLCGKKSCD